MQDDIRTVQIYIPDVTRELEIPLNGQQVEPRRAHVEHDVLAVGNDYGIALHGGIIAPPGGLA